jgi:hypothetical protein
MFTSAISIESVDTVVTLEQCAFNGERNQQVRTKFGQSNLIITANYRFGLNRNAIEEIVGHVIAPIVSAVNALHTREQ